MLTVNHNPTPRDLRGFALAMLGGFAVLAVVLWLFDGSAWVGTGRQRVALALAAVGVLLALIALGPRAISVPVYVGWMTGASWMGRVVTPVLLTVLFVLLLPIFSLIRFADPLRLRLKPPGESYWEDHKHHDATLDRTARPF